MSKFGFPGTGMTRSSKVVAITEDRDGAVTISARRMSDSWDR